MALAGGESAFSTAQAFMSSILGRLMLFGWTFALFFHLSNGIRHLFWDAGYGFEKETVKTSSFIVLAAAGFLTLLVWVVAFTFSSGV